MKFREFVNEDLDHRTIGMIIDFLRARNRGDVVTSWAKQEVLKKKLGRKFNAVLQTHGDPDEPGRFVEVLNAWQRDFQQKVFVKP